MKFVDDDDDDDDDIDIDTNQNPGGLRDAGIHWQWAITSRDVVFGERTTTKNHAPEQDKKKVKCVK